MPRLDKTLADYVAIAISPALIMLMVGSLMWFLVAVFYQGQFDGRIYWILACYVFAIVLITRIAIEEGKERAAMFGLLLAGAVGLATMQFSSSVYFHWILLALAWWAAHKLTMDCTLIDEEQDSSGQGLLQMVGLGKSPSNESEEPAEAKSANQENAPAGAAGAKQPNEPAEPEGVTERVDRMRQEAHPKRRTKGKAHAPGTWIVYFSLAALPLFGLGQMLVPVSDSRERLWTFQLLCTYVAAGLGLLVTTSFVGLRRYLRQRGVQMPPEMAGVWIALGGALIVVLLLVSAILPRPAAEYQIARMPDFPLKFTTPDRRSNRYAVGQEGADENRPQSQSYTQGQPGAGRPEGGKSDHPDSGGSEGSRGKEGQGNQKSSDGKGQGSSSGEKGRQTAAKQDSSSAQQQGSQPSPDEQSSSAAKSPPSPQQSPQDNKSPQSQGDSQQPPSGQEQGDPNSPQGSENQPRDTDNRARQDGEKNQPQSAGSGEERAGQKPADSPQTDHEPSQRRKPPENARQDSRQADDPRQNAATRKENEENQDQRSGRTDIKTPSEPPPQPSEPPFQLPQITLSGGLFGMLKFLLYAALGCMALYWLLRNWSRVTEGFRQFLQDLRDLWARLFGGKPKSAEQAPQEEKPAAVPERAFRDYVDPFAAGLAARYAPAELVRYTFEATEAWARENGCRRDPDQTPHEFAARLGRHVESLQAGAAALARLYCQAAYAPGTLAAEGLAPLADWWRQLRTAAPPAAVPPPIQTAG